MENMEDQNARLIRFLQASPAQQAAIDRILDGEAPAQAAANDGPLLLGMGAAAKRLNVSRTTLYRIIQRGRLEKVEILPGSYRIRRADLEALAAGRESE